MCRGYEKEVQKDEGMRLEEVSKNKDQASIFFYGNDKSVVIEIVADLG